MWKHFGTWEDLGRDFPGVMGEKDLYGGENRSSGDDKKD